MQFISGTITVLIIYYLYVLVRYYPDKIKSFFAFKGKKSEANSSLIQYEAGEATDDESPEDEYDELTAIEELVSSLQVLIREGSENITEAEDFKQEIAIVLRGATHLKSSPYRTSINELIQSECSKYGTFTLSEKEVDELWEETV
jgi:hypothetical protein